MGIRPASAFSVSNNVNDGLSSDFDTTGYAGLAARLYNKIEWVICISDLADDRRPHVFRK